ncbi:ABC transporter ATP-binding protein [Rhodococcus sp. ABRD24]|uniref:dipeptide ABC transporter ATP-binding protein n=1 Tax=Rhodococcus sp. ABRD24 TaxID=2507582 RepID=UPI00103D74E6|nr:ABC transporter ATP-binding protein [Rhodococcus sp. ABRD24]QBJ96716.1 ABC transporter ATP-binding protein [Rhodococcus sp. ABRD24]
MNVPKVQPGDAAVLSVEELTIKYSHRGNAVAAVSQVSFTIEPGQKVALVGASGSGKSSTIAAIIGLLAENSSVAHGSINFLGRNLLELSTREMRRVRGLHIGFVPQDPLSNLNPMLKIGTQVAECLTAHGKFSRDALEERVLEALRSAGIANPEERVTQYPHELSGGLRQRVLIAMGLANKPELLIADEPTSALDVTVQRQIMNQLDEMVAQTGTSLLLVTHDLGLAAERCDRVLVMEQGHIVEMGSSADVLQRPQHPYTKALLAAVPAGSAPASTEVDASSTAPALVRFDGVNKTYQLGRRRTPIAANKDIHLEVPRGSAVGVVGESGSGKTTIARLLLQLEKPTSGRIVFDNEDIGTMCKQRLLAFRRRVQPVFQDPYSSLNPSFTVRSILAEPLKVHRICPSSEVSARIDQLMDQVGLSRTLRDRHPAELSGGQRQRVAIARALAVEPELLVCDEPVSALDVLVQEQVLEVFEKLRLEFGLSYMFISHDLAVVRKLCDYIYVMKGGHIVESGATSTVFDNPQHDYTKLLLESARMRPVESICEVLRPGA